MPDSINPLEGWDDLEVNGKLDIGFVVKDDERTCACPLGPKFFFRNECCSNFGTRL